MREKDLIAPMTGREYKQQWLDREFTDSEILEEAERRGLIITALVETHVPERYVENGYKWVDQLYETMKRAPAAIVAECARTGTQPRGIRVESVRPYEGPLHDVFRRMTIPVKIVVERDWRR